MLEYVVSNKDLSGALFDFYRCRVPLEIVRFMNAVQQERIIRCRDCKHYVMRNVISGTQHRCSNFCETNGAEAWINPDGFCAWAEPKEGE